MQLCLEIIGSLESQVISPVQVMCSGSQTWGFCGQLRLCWVYRFSGVSQVLKNRPTNSGDTCLIPGSEDPLKKGMATHSSILAWRIPWTEEPRGLKPMGHKESDTTKATAHTHMRVPVSSTFHVLSPYADAVIFGDIWLIILPIS